MFSLAFAIDLASGDFAAQRGHHEAVECLLEKKANADAEDKVNSIINSVGLKRQVLPLTVT